MFIVPLAQRFKLLIMLGKNYSLDAENSPMKDIYYCVFVAQFVALKMVVETDHLAKKSSVLAVMLFNNASKNADWVK